MVLWGPALRSQRHHSRLPYLGDRLPTPLANDHEEYAYLSGISSAIGPYVWVSLRCNQPSDAVLFDL